MPTFSKLPEPYVERMKTLFPEGPEFLELLFKIDEWSRRETELTPQQAKAVLDAIQRYAIPQAQALVGKQRLPELRDDAGKRLAEWQAMEALLAEAR